MYRLLILFLFLLCAGLNAPAQRANTRQRQTQQNTSQRRQPSKREQLQQQQRKLKQQREANERRKRELESQVQQRMRDVLALGTEITDKQLLIDSLKVQMDSTDRSICLLDSQLSILQAELQDRQQRYIRSMRYMYRTRRSQSQLMFVLSAANFNQMYRRSRFTEEYATYQKAQGEAVKQKREQTEQKQKELTLARNRQAALLAQGEKERRNLSNKQQEQQQLVDGLKQQQKTVQNLIARQMQEEAELNARIDKLIQEEIAAAQRRAEEERRRKEEAAARQRQHEQQSREAQQRQANGGSSRGRNNGRNRANNRNTNDDRLMAYNETDADRLSNQSFAKCKGRLPVPITGNYRIVRNFGPYTVSGLPNVHLDSKGIHLQGQAGAKARCIFDGEVSSVFNRDGKYIVMVRHGKYISVYCNLASVSVASGQKVRINQTLGAVAADNILQFRLQKGFDILNPRNWISR